MQVVAIDPSTRALANASGLKFLDASCSTFTRSTFTCFYTLRLIPLKKQCKVLQEARPLYRDTARGASHFEALARQAGFDIRSRRSGPFVPPGAGADLSLHSRHAPRIPLVRLQDVPR